MVLAAPAPRSRSLPVCFRPPGFRRRSGGAGGGRCGCVRGGRLEEQTLVNIGKAPPDDLHPVEQRLKADGSYAGEPKGYFGPQVRKALAAWVDAKGPLGDIAAPPAVGALQQGEDPVATEIIERLRDRAFELAMAAKTDDERLAALELLNALARYGDIAPRWALVRNYHQAKVVRSVVTPAEVVRYALDLLVTRPPSVRMRGSSSLDLPRLPGTASSMRWRSGCGDARSPPAVAQACRYH